MSTKEKKTNCDKDFAELMVEYNASKVNEKERNKKNLEKEKLEFEMAWLAAGLKIFKN
tara:strand:+ start:2345 stop:2518 length:174 start_codon:yes stop_codon:yes gene_type:complete